MLQQECTRATCPEMKAGEWMYLCVAHGNDGAMEVSLMFFMMQGHHLMVAAAMLRHRLHFTHRRQCNGATQFTTSIPFTVGVTRPSAFLFLPLLTSLQRINIPSPSHRHFGSLARRLGRIFAHAYFHHREVFEQAEAESSLYHRFLVLTCKFDLVPPEFLIIPTPTGLSDEPEPPRLLAAAVDPQHQSGSDDENDDRGRGTHRVLGMDILSSIDRNPSPRKGRNRTGTMIFSEALIMADELSKGGGSPSPERESEVHIPTASSEIHESESDFVHVDVSSREEKEEHYEEEQHESHLDSPPTEKKKSDFGMLSLSLSPDEEKSDFGLDDPLEEEEEHVPTLSEVHTHVEAIQDHHAPEQDVTDDAEDSDDDDDDVVTEHADEAPGHDVTSAHETSGTTTTIIELPPAEDMDALEEDAQEEDLTEAVVEPQYEEDDSADAQEVAEQIALDEPHDHPTTT
jgi:Mob1/phocein family protein